MLFVLGVWLKKARIIRAQKGLNVRFKVTDYSKTVTVVHTGILPDLFREGQGIVAEGVLVDNQHLQATRFWQNMMPIICLLKLKLLWLKR